MKLRPIIFRGDMVRAILDGRKTQTRRIVKTPHADEADAWAYNPERGLWESGISAGFGQFGVGERVHCPFGAVGDELWVRETWGVGTRPDPHDGWRDGVEYKADCHGLDEGDDLPLHRVSVPDGVDLDALIGPWRSPRFMPRWASRLTLVVRSVRVERLSAITDADAVAEGCVDDGEVWRLGDSRAYGRPARAAYRAAFRAMHKLAADADPWLWVVGFERKEAA